MPDLGQCFPPSLSFFSRASDIPAVVTIFTVLSYDAVLRPRIEPITYLVTSRSTTCYAKISCFLLEVRFRLLLCHITNIFLKKQKKVLKIARKVWEGGISVIKRFIRGNQTFLFLNDKRNSND